MAEYHSCNACEISFDDSITHRAHYRTDWHRYNLRRRTVDLHPMPFEQFEERKNAVLSRRDEAESEKAAEDDQAKQLHCSACRKTFASANMQKQHLNSKKHKAKMKKLGSAKPKAKGKAKGKAKAARSPPALPKPSGQTVGSSEACSETGHTTSEATVGSSEACSDDETPPTISEATALSQASQVSVVASPAEPEDDRDTRSLEPLECVFCGIISKNLKRQMEHMKTAHEFVLPDRKFVSNLPGLLEYFGDKVGIGHLCLYCDKGFSSLGATRGHMASVGHCRIPFEEGKDLEEYYEFYTYGPLVEGTRGAALAWHSAVAACGDYDSFLEKRKTIEYDEEYDELVLLDGRRVGHRRNKQFYKQHYAPEDNRPEILCARKMLLERHVGSEMAAQIIRDAAAASGERGARAKTSRSVALSLVHARDRKLAAVKAKDASKYQNQAYERKRLNIGHVMNKVNVSKIPHKRGVFVSWKK